MGLLWQEMAGLLSRELVSQLAGMVKCAGARTADGFAGYFICTQELL